MTRTEVPDTGRESRILACRLLVAGIAPHSEAIHEEREERFGVERLQALIIELNALCDIEPSITGSETRRCRTPKTLTDGRKTAR